MTEIPDGSAVPRRRPRAVRALRMAVGAAVLIALAAVVVDRWDQVRGELSQVTPTALAASLALALLGTTVSMLAWRRLLDDLGSPLRVRTAAQVFFVAQLAKYLPGSTVWAVLAQVELARDLGVPRSRTVAAGLLSNLMSLGVATLVALLALPQLLRADGPSWLRWSPLVAVAGVIVLAPPVLRRLLVVLFRVLRRPEVGPALSWRGTASVTGLLLVMWILFGMHALVLAASLGADPVRLAVPAVGAFAASWAAGFLVFLVPTGAGTRELLLTLTMAPLLPGGVAAALTLAIVSRLLMTLADACAGGAGLLLWRRIPRG